MIATGYTPLRAALAEELRREGWVKSEEWAEVFATVPRHQFLPRFFVQNANHTGWLACDETSPDYAELVYQNATLVTQLDDEDKKWDEARTAGVATGQPTSSSTAPGLMALMLESLRLDSEHRVLEVGTGTGYNAALMAQYLGDSQVVSIEVDAGVAERAGLALAAAGYSPKLVTGDGTLGYEVGAPYDRIIATCSAPSIPSAWINQVRKGGLILTNLYRELGGGALVLLNVQGNGTVEGPILADYGGFMPLRAARTSGAESLLAEALQSTDGVRRHADVSVEAMNDQDLLMFVALHLPGVASLWFNTHGEDQYWLLGSDGSWAALTPVTQCVEQGGKRDLWTEVERLYDVWMNMGAPHRGQLGITVTPTGQHRLWHRYVGNVVSVLPH